MTQLAAKWVLTFTTLWLAGCLGTLSGGPVRGQVLDSQTHQPLPGAIVVVLWKGNVSGSWVDSHTVCYHVETTTADATGNYLIPKWSQKITQDWEGGIYDKDRFINAYKLGYQRSSLNPGQPEDILLEPFRGKVGERLEYLSRAAASCSDRREIEIKLLPLYQVLYAEAQRLAVTKDEKLKALYRLRDIERLQVGSDKAWENFRKRQGELQ